MSKILFIANVFNLKISKPLTTPISLMPGMFITNNRSKIYPLLSSGFKRAVGDIEYEAIRNGTAVIYGLYPDAVMQGLSDLDFLLANLKWSSEVLQATWLLKDNCFNIELGFLEAPHYAQTSSVSSNFLKQQVSLSASLPQEVELTPDEIKQVVDLHDAIQTSLHSQNPSATHHLEKNYSRLGRVWSLLAEARAATNVGNKIASYCTCYEALFSTETTELSHKLAERIAHFLGSTTSEKMEIYANLKNAYSVRSKVVHGDGLSVNQLAGLIKVSETCDEYLRKSLVKIFSSQGVQEVFNQNSNKLDEYFLKLVFGNVS